MKYTVLLFTQGDENNQQRKERVMKLDEILEHCPLNQTIVDNIIRAYSKINTPLYKNIICSISGGSDSDIMLDILMQIDKDKKIQYVWFDTGLEYQATKDHLKYLEQKYCIEIKTYRAIKPIPTCCKQYGQPFLSKQVSEFIQRLQRHSFKWEDRPFEELLKEYPNCKAALKWWCNEWGEKSKFNISYNKYLKEFIIAHPIPLYISNKCCHYAKKEVAKKIKIETDCDLSIVGVRKAEGGARSSAHKSCFSSNDICDEYRPIFWYKEQDKRDYERHYNITHNNCYTEYGLSRTGCAGCPFGKDFEFELEVIKQYEPKLYVAVNNIFGDSYEYTRRYREFVKSQKRGD